MLVEAVGLTDGSSPLRAATVTAASTNAGTNISAWSTHAAWPRRDVVHGGARDPAGQRELTGRRDDLVVLVTTTAVGTSMRESHGRVWCRPSAARACPTAHGLVRAQLGQRPSWMSLGARSTASAARRSRRGVSAARAREAAAGRAWSSPIEAWKTLLRRGRPEVVGGGGEHQALDRVRVLAPDALRHDRAHRVAADDRVAQAEHLDHGGDVVGAVGERELLGLDAAPVPALVQRHDPEAARQRLDRRDTS